MSKRNLRNGLVAALVAILIAVGTVALAALPAVDSGHILLRSEPVPAGSQIRIADGPYIDPWGGDLARV